MKTILKNIVLVSLLGTIALQAAPASAQTVSKRVSYADLDLATAAGQKTLERRISRAVREVCGRGMGAISAYDIVSTSRCMAEARNSTRDQFAFAVRRAQLGQVRKELASR